VTYTAERVAPFDRPTTTFLSHHFRFLRSLVRPHLPPPLQGQFDRLTDPTGADSLFAMPDVELACVNVVYLARPTPVSERGRAESARSR
jgi:hypothetical protein